MPRDMADISNREAVFAQIVAKCWMDSRFKSKLMSDPTETARQAGLDIPAPKYLKVYESTHSVEVIPLLSAEQARLLITWARDTKDERAEVYGELLLRLAEDVNFRTEIEADPNTIRQHLGFALPSRKKAKLVKIADDELVLVLPPKPPANLFGKVPLTDEIVSPHMTAAQIAGVVYGSAAGGACLVAAGILGHAQAG